MPYVYADAAKLEKTPKVGSGQCVALVQHYAGLPGTIGWHEGEKVLNNASIKPGTAIATFVKGRYLSHATGNHAAFFLRHGANGFYVMDQWKNKEDVSERFIPYRKGPKNADGSYYNASNNADAYSVIE
ncbi:MAG: BPSL0067 family protein [Gammaproteobacteria bacterium]